MNTEVLINISVLPLISITCYLSVALNEHLTVFIYKNFVFVVALLTRRALRTTNRNKQNERNPVLDAGEKPEQPEKNLPVDLKKQVWIGNHMDIGHTPGVEPGLSFPQRRESTAIPGPLCYLLPQSPGLLLRKAMQIILENIHLVQHKFFSLRPFQPSFVQANRCMKIPFVFP